MTTLRLLSLTSAALVCSLLASWTCAEAPKPNIVHIFADDLGKASVGVYGQLAREQASLPHIKTPHLDALASAGMSFEKAYAATLCSPSRGMLMMGFNQAHNANDRNTVAPRAQDVSVAEVLKQAGYNTSVWGKWGFGGSGGTQTGPKEDDLRLNPTVSNLDALPTTNGFDEFTGYLNHSRAHRYFVSSLWTTDSTGNPVTGGLSEQMLGNIGPNNSNLHANYTHDIVAARSEQYIEDNYQDSDPFYMQVNYTIPHNDLEAIQFVPGWFDDYAGVNTSSWTDKERYYAAMITRMDNSIGSLIDKLEDPNGDGDTSDSVMDNTIIMFTSDNGATNADFSNSGLNHFGLLDNPWRGGKRDLWEGGINMPQFVRWDGVVQPGSSTDHLTDLTDFMATAADLAGVDAPVGIDGHSLAPLLTGQGIQRERDYLVFEHHEGDGPDPNSLNPRWAIIRGDYKLIEFSNGEQRLYNLATDPDENNQLNQSIQANADLVTELTSLAIAEGVEQPAGYDHEYGSWNGPDGGELNTGSNWNLASAPGPTWSTVVNNTSGTDRIALANNSVDTLGFEVQGDNGQQTVRVYREEKLTGRNEVRIDAGGRLNLDDATLESWRWTDVKAGGELTGHGTVEGDLYNMGTVSPGVPSDLSEAPALHGNNEIPLGVDTGVVAAVTFDFTGIQDNGPITQTSALNQYLEVTQGYDLGSGISVRHTTKPGSSDTGDEFNVTGFAGNNTTVTDAINGDDYLGFKVDPIFGIEMLVDQISFELWRNGSGAAQEFAILTNLDGFTAGNELATLNLNSGDTSTHVLTGSYNGGQWTQDEVDVRIYGWDQEGGSGNTHFTAASMTASFRTISSPPGSDVSLDPTGILTLNGNFFHIAGALIELDLGGDNNSDALDPEFDQLIINGAAFLEGALEVALFDEGQGVFAPDLGDLFEIVSATEGVNGQFSSIDLPTLGGGLDWEVIYNSNSVQLQVVAVLAGDYNFDGVVDAADYTVWRNSLGSTGTGLVADGDGNGTVGPEDYTIWASSYGNTSSTSASSSQAIPEPTCMLLLCLGALSMLNPSRRS